LRKWKFVRLEFTPVQYNPVAGKLKVSRSLRAVISFQRIGTRVYRTNPALRDTLQDEEARKRFFNFEEAKPWYRYAPEDESRLPQSPPAQNPGLAVITTNAISAQSLRLSDFLRQKGALGFNVHLVTEDQYNGLQGQAPNGRAQKIRQWLIDNYIPLGIQYVLLIGGPDPINPADPSDSAGDVPMLLAWPNRDYGFNVDCPTDHYYADLTGNWDLDGDGFYGEFRRSTDPESPSPGIGPDRFSARWTGRIMADAQGTYYFKTYSDEGVRLFIDNIRVIDNWNPHLPAFDNGSLTLSPGLHDIRVEYFDVQGDGVLNITWRRPGQSYEDYLRGTHLYYRSGNNFTAGGLLGEYFNRLVDFGSANIPAADMSRVDSTMVFFWGRGDRGPGGVDFSPEVVVGRLPVYGGDIAALDRILQKTMIYQAAPAIPGWRRRVLLPMKPSDQSTPACDLGENIKNDGVIPNGLAYFRIYDAHASCTAGEKSPCTEANVLDEWKQGYGLVTWWTHGTPVTAISVFSSGACPNLDDEKAAFTFQASCSNGHPETANNLGYSLLRHGAVATVSGSRLTYYAPGIQPPNPLSSSNQHLAYAYSCKIMQNADAGHGLYQTIGAASPDGLWSNMMGYNLYGDPTLALLAAHALGPDYTLNSLGLSQASVAPGGSVQLDTVALNQGGSPAPGRCILLAAYLSSDTTLDPSDRQLLNWPLPPCTLPAGESSPQATTLQIPDDVAPQQYYLIVKIDSENRQPEYNEDNNTAARALTVAEETSRWFSAYSALNLQSQDVAALRRYRDQVLGTSWTGRLLTACLYADAKESLRVLTGDAALMAAARRFLDQYKTSVGDVLAGRPASVANVQELAAFLGRFADRSPLRLKLLAEWVRFDLLRKQQRGEDFFGFRLAPAMPGLGGALTADSVP
jgi:hypothetical protein